MTLEEQCKMLGLATAPPAIPLEGDFYVDCAENLTFTFYDGQWNISNDTAYQTVWYHSKKAGHTTMPHKLNIDTAEGIELDYIGEHFGIARHSSRFSNLEMDITFRYKIRASVIDQEAKNLYTLSRKYFLPKIKIHTWQLEGVEQRWKDIVEEIEDGNNGPNITR